MRVSARLVDAATAARPLVRALGPARPTTCSPCRASWPRRSPAGSRAPYSGQIIAADRDAAKRKPPKQPHRLRSLSAGHGGARPRHPRGLGRVRSAAAAEHRDRPELRARLDRARPDLCRSRRDDRLSRRPAAGPRRRRRRRRWRSIRATPRRMRLWPPTTWTRATRLGPRAEFDKALRLNPGSADLLSIYAGWASNFGKPEEGVAAAERAMRLNPDTPRLGALQFRLRLFHGRPLRRCAAHVQPHAGGYLHAQRLCLSRGDARGARRHGGGQAGGGRTRQAIPGSASRPSRPIRARTDPSATGWSRPCAPPASPPARRRRRAPPSPTFSGCRSALPRDAPATAAAVCPPCAPSRRRRAI